MTDQIDPNSGAIDIFCCSHWPLNLAAEIQKDSKKFDFFWFNKIQLLLKINQGVLFSGNVFHQIHGNSTTKDRLTAFWVFEIKNDDNELEYENNILPDIKWDRYDLEEFSWITKRTDFLIWNNKNIQNYFVYWMCQYIRKTLQELKNNPFWRGWE